MEQVMQFVAGERDYTKIAGGTGPLVYPAAHVYIYTGLYYMTDNGKDIFLAQQLFAILYMATLGMVMACYWQAKVWIRHCFTLEYLELHLQTDWDGRDGTGPETMSERFPKITTLDCKTNMETGSSLYLSSPGTV
jgi:hypothetical protein